MKCADQIPFHELTQRRIFKTPIPLNLMLETINYVSSEKVPDSEEFVKD